MSLTDGWDPPRPGWTCEQCGFEFDATAPSAAADAVRAAGERYGRPLRRGLPGEDLDSLLRVKPTPETWSALEYACHVRDVLDLNVARITRMLAEDRPELHPMNRDAIAVERRYNEQRPPDVADELAASAERLAATFASVGDGDWDRTAVREGIELSVDWMARNVVHECTHHLLDIGRVLREARGR